MKKQKWLRKLSVLLLALVMAVSAAAPAFASEIPDAPDSYVLDDSDVISASTESYINEKNNALADACGAQIVFVVVDFTGSYSTHDYAYEVFNKWGIGDKDENNGMLYVLAVGAEDYYALPGEGVLDILSGSALQAILDDYMEPDFAAGDYDAAIKKTFDRTLAIMENEYNVTYSSGSTTTTQNEYNAYEEARGQGSWFAARLLSFFGKLVTIVIIIIVIVMLIRMFSGPRGGGGSGGGGGGGFWNGWLLGSMMNRRRYYHRPPPPRPPFGGPRPPRNNGGFGGHPGGFGGGFGGGRPGGSRPGGGFGGSRPSGGFGGGRSGGFGGGRSGGGVGRSGGFGGGGSRGGGAGRR
ncbi:MAG: TPM domain-containing protein [Clostridia bacterium]|nr:TPM domain-containing protein [Clostridia bacterium]